MLACSGPEVVVAPVSGPFNAVVTVDFLAQKLIYTRPRIFHDTIQIITKEIVIANPFVL